MTVLTIAQISAYYQAMPKRKPGGLLPIETSILAIMVERELQMRPGIHGYDLAKDLALREHRKLLAGHGTIYRALSRLEDARLVTSSWEVLDPQAEPDRPRRRFYRVTPAGVEALATAAAVGVPSLQPIEG